MSETTASLPRGARSIRAAALLAVFMISLDVSIVNIALPTLADDLGASLSSLQWVLDGYIAAFASLLLLTAKFSRATGPLTTMRIGVLGFTVASVACALAWTATALVVARILQGIAASLILPSGLTLVTRLAGDHQLGRALGAFSAVVGAATALGPGAGALMLSHFGWPGIFLVNVPIGLGVLWSLRGEERAPAMHGSGAAWRDGALSAAGLFALCFGLIEVGRHGWGSARALAASAAGLLALALFGLVQVRRGQAAILDIALLQRRSVLGANVATLLTFTAMMGATFLAPLVLTQLYGYSLDRTAAAMSVTSILILAVALVSGRLAEMMRPAAVAGLGCVVEGAALWGFSVLGPRPAFASVVLAAATLGLGIGLVLPPLTTWAMTGISANRVEDASALFSTSRQIGLAVGVAVFGSLASTEISQELARVSGPGLASAPELAQLSLTQLEQGTAARAVSSTVTHAIWAGLATTFRIGSIIALLAVVPILIFGRRGGVEPTDEERVPNVARGRHRRAAATGGLE